MDRRFRNLSLLSFFGVRRWIAAFAFLHSFSSVGLQTHFHSLASLPLQRKAAPPQDKAVMQHVMHDRAPKRLRLLTV